MSLAFLFHYLMLNMFRMLIHPFSGACDLFVELFHGLYFSGSMCVGVTLWFGWGGMVSGCRLQPASGYMWICLCFKCKNLKKKQRDGWSGNSIAIMPTDQPLQLDSKRRLCQMTRYPIAGLANLWLLCLEWHAAFTSVPVFFHSFAPPASLYCEEHVYMYTYVTA